MGKHSSEVIRVIAEGFNGRAFGKMQWRPLSTSIFITLEAGVLPHVNEYYITLKSYHHAQQTSYSVIILATNE